MDEHLKTIAEELSNIEYNTREQTNEVNQNASEELHSIQWQLTRIANTLEQMANKKE
tara:strand:+ start:673 stop:843 length:171 start_codon:yes stop_codon:yes gene_type:complete